MYVYVTASKVYNACEGLNRLMSNVTLDALRAYHIGMGGLGATVRELLFKKKKGLSLSIFIHALQILMPIVSKRHNSSIKKHYIIQWDTEN